MEQEIKQIDRGWLGGGCQNNYIHSYEGLSISMQVLLFSWQK